MKNKKLTIISLLLFSLSYGHAQRPHETLKITPPPLNTQKALTINANEAVEGDSPESKAWDYISKNWSKRKHKSAPENSLKLLNAKEMIAGDLVQYKQLYKKLIVENCFISVRIDKKNIVRTVINTTRPIDTDLKIIPKISSEKALNIVKTHLNAKVSPEYQTSELVIYFYKNAPLLSYKIRMVPEHPSGDWVAYVDAITGEIMEVKDVMIYCGRKTNKQHKNNTKKDNLNHNKKSNKPRFKNSHELSVVVDGMGKAFDPTPTYSNLLQPTPLKPFLKTLGLLTHKVTLICRPTVMIRTGSLKTRWSRCHYWTLPKLMVHFFWVGLMQKLLI